ncbi:unnamed protein product [Adineta steineri]|uniref:Uncharacterized protein n=1 Tax=Adineta steineri TaxID=433720 RepID=A0A814M950_9BILA|nr:unnamed protein product [Adineta steineri]
MQTAESVCLWNYQFKNNSPPSPINNMSIKKTSPDNTPYLTCTERLSCQNEMSSKATFYCVQCGSLQCILCEKEIHENSTNDKHERLNLDEIDDEICSVDRRHQAVFYCRTCTLAFCYSCYENQHQHSDGREHKPQKYREGQTFINKTNNNQQQIETQPIKIVSSSNVNTNNIKPSASSFEDVRVDDSDENCTTPPSRKEHSKKSTTRQNNTKSNHVPKRHNFNQQMLLESMLDDGENDQSDKINNRLLQQNHTDSNRGFLLLDANEHLTINNESEFLRRLKSDKDLCVKCVSVIGNTGDGKSYTLNQVFFNGQEIFNTSSTADSCTMGVWSALDDNHRTLVLDTEGRLGLSENDNTRNRLLLKILCISDIVIYRTRASKLPNDMFQFLSDASNAFLKYFRKELENVMKNCKADGPMSTMGPTLIVFHETQHTGILKDHFQCQKTAVEQLKERFETMNLSYDAYSSLEYVGIQTTGDKPSDFSTIKATIAATLNNNNIRSRRRLSVIFKALKALNEKFNHAIPPSIPSTLPDDFFACCVKCLSCGTKCTMVANHHKDHIPHECDTRCSYSKEFDNEVWKCLQCHRDGRDVIVYGKLITKNDGLVQGLLKYVWSGCVIECPYHGEIYRSRKHWYGNNEPKDVTRVEIIHVWPDDDNSRLASDVTPRKFMELIVYASSYLSAPTKMITEMVADQVAPSYWIPNKDVIACSSCKLLFGSEFSKHHCRACGHVFCDTCTTYRRIVPWIDTENTVRVCNNCNDNPKSRAPSYTLPLSETNKQFSQKSSENGSSGDSGSTVSSGEHLNDLCLTPTDIFDIEQPSTGPVIVDIPTTRRVYETVKNGLEKIGVNYPIELIKESTRPSYWKPDSECHACCICKRTFNSTTNRLHHCRSCGEGVCESCSPIQRPVPERDWLTPMFMYNGYSSYDSEIQRHSVCNSSLSSNVPLSVAEKIAEPYLTHVSELIMSNRPFPIAVDKDFKWALEIFAFGFTSEHSSIYQLCANIYVEWLKVFEGTSVNSSSIPPILREKTEFYWSQMFWHLYHLFVIHDEKSADLLTKRMYTHKVLRQLQTMISQTELSLDLWHILLQVFLAIGDTVLSPSYRTNEEGSAVMSHRLVPSIYQVFMVAVDKVHIPPGLWRTFRDYAVTWRHRPAVVYDWAQLTCVLASTVVHKLWWPDLVPLQYVCTETDQGEYVQKIIDSLSFNLLVTTWIQFLTILQNPSECGDVSVFLRMPKYTGQLQINSNTKLKELTSLQELPRIFVNVTKAIGMFVDIWLGKEIDPTCLYSPKPTTNSTATMADNSTSSNIPSAQSRPFAQSMRGNPPVSQQQQSSTLKPKSQADNRKVSVPPGQILSPTAPPVNATLLSSIPQQNRPEQISKILRTNRPTVNSLMHLYGPWILDACLLQTKDRHTRSPTIINTNDSSRMNEIDKTLDIQNERLMDEAFAKSFATLCTIFGSAQCDEFIHPEYLSRFYYVLQQGLRFYQGDEQRSYAIIESILLNSADLFRINLRGINILLPLYLDAIEYYLQNDFQTYIHNHFNTKGIVNSSTIHDRFIRIRSKCIQILMSVVSLPFHYEYLQQHLFEDYLEKSHDVQVTLKTFSQYRSKIFPLLLMALQTEQDTTNAQLLFGTIRLACSLAAHFERQQEQSEDKIQKDPTSDYLSHAVLLICDKGTNDSQLFLAALDTLISLVTDPVCQLPIEMWKKVLKRLCTFIDTQLHLGHTHHTREMHSTCVATYNTLITLIIERPTLLDDPENLYELCEIIELGISGEKAQSSEKVVTKKYKEQHPASQRVAEAAEYLMCVLFEHKTINRITNMSQRSETGACLHVERNGDIINEEAVLHLKNDICRNWLDETTFANLMTSTRFKYFAVNENTLFAINELPISINNGMPAIILLCRGLFGKNVWTLNFRHNPINNSIVQRNKSHERTLNESDKSTSSSVTNSSNDQKEKHHLSHSTRNERAKSELSIPTLNSIVKRDEEKLNLFRTLKTKQITIEEKAIQRAHLIDEKPIPECKPPECQKHFEGIRLFLSHYGYCSLDSMNHLLNGKQWNQSNTLDQLQPRIKLLDSNIPTFMDDIKILDKISPTLYCTGQIFYLKRDQNSINESFLNTKTPEQLNPAFLTMISQFGSVVEIKRHCGWTGNVETSWKTVSDAQSNQGPNSKILHEIDGDDSILYWVDLTTEMAFYLPHQFSADSHGSEMRILIVWLEQFHDDLDSILPVAEQQSKSRDISIIGIHPLKNHLLRISLNSNAQRMQSACASIPLIDGMVIPLHILPFFLRQAVHNLSRRKRLEDSQISQTAYSVRKNKITRIIDKYQNRINNNLDEFFQNIFFSSSSTTTTTSKQQQQPIVTHSTSRPNSMIVVQS